MELPTSPVVERDLGDGVARRFMLTSDELRMIKRECGRGFYTLYSNFAADAEPDEVATVLRLALIGGGMDPLEALTIVNYYARPPRPLKAAYLLAFEVLSACWAGVELDQKKSDEGPVTDEDLDLFFDRIEAKLAAGGGDTSVIRGKTFAEVQQLVRLSRQGAKEDQDGGSAPDDDMFNAIKQQGKK